MGGADIEYPGDGTPLDKTKWFLGLGGEPGATPIWVIVATLLPVMVGCLFLAGWLINDHWLTDLGAVVVAAIIHLPILRRTEDHYAGAAHDLAPES